MKDAILAFILLLAIFLALILQEFLPPLDGVGGSKMQFVPLLFCLGALGLPYPWMLFLALGGGFLLDIMSLQFLNNQPEIGLSTAVFFLLLVGAICQGLRPMFLRGHWWLLGLMAGLSTAAWPALQFLLLSLRRLEEGGWQWHEEILWRIFLPAAFAAVISPVLFFLLRLIAGPFPYRKREPAYR